MKQCPDCKGSRFTTGIGCFGKGRGCEVMTINCFTCGGTGTIDEAHAERIAKGRAMYDDRVSRDMGLREEARRLGITARELSDLENGRKR